VHEAARQWYEQDKANNLDEGLHEVMRKVTDLVVGKRYGRSLLVPRELERHPAIQRRPWVAAELIR
jgi:hypothetical protein